MASVDLAGARDLDEVMRQPPQIVAAPLAASAIRKIGFQNTPSRRQLAEGPTLPWTGYPAGLGNRDAGSEQWSFAIGDAGWRHRSLLSSAALSSSQTERQLTIQDGSDAIV